MIICEYNTVFAKSDFWSKIRQPALVSPISWRKSIRKALNVPARTHSVYLPLICECLPLNVQLDLRVMKFFMKRYEHYKQNVSFFYLIMLV